MADNLINIVSYNSTGLGAVKMEYLKDFLSRNKVDILFLQETWLLPGNMDKLADIHSDYLYHGVSGIENSKLYVYSQCVLLRTDKSEYLQYQNKSSNVAEIYISEKSNDH